MKVNRWIFFLLVFSVISKGQASNYTMTEIQQFQNLRFSVLQEDKAHVELAVKMPQPYELHLKSTQNGETKFHFKDKNKKIEYCNENIYIFIDKSFKFGLDSFHKVFPVQYFASFKLKDIFDSNSHLTREKNSSVSYFFADTKAISHLFCKLNEKGRLVPGMNQLVMMKTIPVGPVLAKVYYEAKYDMTCSDEAKAALKSKMEEFLGGCEIIVSIGVLQTLR